MNKEKEEEIVNKILKSKVWEFIFVFIYPIFILWITESINSIYFIDQIAQFIGIVGNGIHILLLRFLLPYLLIILLSVFFRLISKNSFISNLILTIVCFLITIISYYKIQTLEIPLLVTDVFLLKNIFQIAGYGNLVFEPRIIGIIILLIILLVIQFFIVRYQEKRHISKKMIVARVILAVIVCVIILKGSTINKLPYNIRIIDKQFEFEQDYDTYGATFMFFKSIENLFPKKAEGYSEEKINEIKANVEENQEDTGVEEVVKPNVIVIMSESLFDITKVENLKLSKDPLENIKEISKQYYGGNLVSPTYAGGTSQPEFEFLTGLSTNFFDDSVYPYSQYVNGEINSIVKTYGNNNYECTAIHPNGGNFYNRKVAYEFIGFDNTIFIEDMVVSKEEENDEYVGNYISDRELTRQIIKSYENGDSDKNKFIFAISIQNHTPYSTEDYTNYDVDIEYMENNIPKNDKESILAYTQGIYDSDKAFKELVEYFEQKEEPTIIVIFGDHLPSIDSLEDLYYGKDNLKKRQTPYCVYTNYEVGENIEFEENISAANLGLKILEMSNIQLPWYYQYIQNTYEKYPVITSNFIINQNNEIVTETDIDRIKNYQILQYDLLHKRKYIPVN